MPSTKRKKKDIADGWPVSFSPLKKPSKKKKEEETLDFVCSSSEESSPSSSQKLELPALETGTVLEACNGSDIQLARGASAQPNLAKGRGRYLIILPGMLSLKTQQKKTTPAKQAADEKNESGTGGKSEAETSQDEAVSETASQEEETSPKDAKTPAKRKPFTPRVTTLGKILDIETDHPVMKVPFHNGRSLVFQGKKVKTSSKFMMMNCKASKGSVGCKDIFSSAIVFGEAKWEGEGAEEASADDGAAVAKSDDADAPTFRHYGGSNRTVDGVVTSATVKKQLAKKRAAAKPSSNAETSKADVNEFDDDGDESGSEADDINIGATPPPRAPRPKRRAASQTKSILESLDDSEEEESSEESDSDVEMKQAPAPPPRATTKRRASSQMKKIVVDIAGSDESSGASDVEMGEAPPPRAARPKRRASSQKKIVKMLSSSDEEGSSEEDEDTPPARAPSKQKRKAASMKKAPVAAKRARTGTVQVKKKEKPALDDDDLSFESCASDEVVVVEDKTTPEKKKPAGLATPVGTPRTAHARRLAKMAAQGSVEKASKKIDLTEDKSCDEFSANDDGSEEEHTTKKSRSRKSIKKAKEIDLTEDCSEEESSESELEVGGDDEDESDYEE